MFTKRIHDNPPEAEASSSPNILAIHLATLGEEMPPAKEERKMSIQKDTANKFSQQTSSASKIPYISSQLTEQQITNESLQEGKVKQVHLIQVNKFKDKSEKLLQFNKVPLITYSTGTHAMSKTIIIFEVFR